MRAILPLILILILILHGSATSVEKKILEYSDAQEQELKPGEDRALVLSHCSSYHSTNLIDSNRLTRKGWDKTITLMEKTYSLPPLGACVRKKILDYLEVIQGPAESARAGTSAAWVQPLYKLNPIW